MKAPESPVQAREGLRLPRLALRENVGFRERTRCGFLLRRTDGRVRSVASCAGVIVGTQGSTVSTPLAEDCLEIADAKLPAVHRRTGARNRQTSYPRRFSVPPSSLGSKAPVRTKALSAHASPLPHGKVDVEALALR